MPDPASPSFVTARRVVFGIALASYVLSFFHRTAPAAIAGELTRAFEIGGAVLGTLAATYFYVYTVLQVPVGVLADTLGPRRILAAGSLIAGIGSLSFGSPRHGNWRRSAARWSAWASPSHSSRFSRSAPCGSPPIASQPSSASRCSPAIWARSSPARRSRGSSRRRRGARSSSRSGCCRCYWRWAPGGAFATGPSRWASHPCAASRPRRRSAGRMR
jgi:MFS family permease